MWNSIHFSFNLSGATDTVTPYCYRLFNPVFLGLYTAKKLPIFWLLQRRSSFTSNTKLIISGKQRIKNVSLETHWIFYLKGKVQLILHCFLNKLIFWKWKNRLKLFCVLESFLTGNSKVGVTDFREWYITWQKFLCNITTEVWDLFAIFQDERQVLHMTAAALWFKAISDS